MENEILNILQTIRGYVFVLMIIAAVWISLRVVKDLLDIKTKYQEIDNKNFSLRMDRYIDTGQYDEVIDWSKSRLEKYPYNLDANWYIAKAYYFTENNELARKHFDLVLHYAPNWLNSVEPFLNKLDGC